MKHLCKLMSWGVFLLVLTTLVSCTKEQSELSIKDIKGSATILGSLSYSEGQAFSNGQFQELLKPAAGVKVNIKIANASLDPNGTAQGFTTYETTTDGEGNFSIDIPAVENTRVTIQPATFIGKRTLVTEWENNAPVFETEEVVFSINGTEQTVSPGDIIISDDMYGYTTRNFVEGFGETEEISGKIGIGKVIGIRNKASMSLSPLPTTTRRPKATGKRHIWFVNSELLRIGMVTFRQSFR